MTARLTRLFCLLISVLLLEPVLSAQTVPFSYQGLLTVDGVPAAGPYDFQVTIWDDPSAGTQLAEFTAGAIVVNDGIFNLAVEIPHDVFGGAVPRWLQIAAVDSKSGGAYTIIGPRTRIAAAPAALSMPGVTVTGTTEPDLVTIGDGELHVQADSDYGALRVDNLDEFGAGLHVGNLPGTGIFMASVAKSGVRVYQAGDTGVEVGRAGTPDETWFPAGSHGLVVAGAEDFGVYIGWSGNDAIHVNNTLDDGLNVAQAGGDGVFVGLADDYGINADGRLGGAYLRTTEEGSDRPPDVVLGATSGTTYGDDGVIRSDPAYSGSDVILRAEDNVALYLDQDGGNDGDLFVYGNGGAQVFNVDDQGDVSVAGNLSKGGGSFEIDHPLDPANRILRHSFVESPDMKNVYDGTVRLDASGEAVVELPDYFEALNSNFRYQLTCIGGYAPVYVAREIQNNRFRIAGGEPGMKVSWMVTGVRQDAWASQNRIVVEEEKQGEEQGRYLHPGALGQPAERSIRTLERDTPSPTVDEELLIRREEEPAEVRAEAADRR